MNVIMDACSVINLHNGGVLQTVCKIKSIEVQIGPIAGGECSEDCAVVIAALHEEGELKYLSDNGLDSDEFIDFVSLHKLGDGEAECILLARAAEDSCVCSDDLRGRRKTTEILGENRLLGSVGILRLAVSHQLIDSEEALAAYERMKNAGGFLPDIGVEFFMNAGNSGDSLLSKQGSTPNPLP